MIAGAPEPEKATHLARARRVAIAAALAAGLLAAPTAAGSENRHLDLVRSICARRSFRLSYTLTGRNDAYAIDVTAGRASRALLGDVAGGLAARVDLFIASPGLAVAGAPIHAGLSRALDFAGATRARRDAAIELVLVWLLAAAPLGLGTWALARALEGLGLASAAGATDSAAVYALATLALPYGAIFDPSSLAICLVLCALAAIAHARARAWLGALAGLCAGVAVACEPQALAPLLVVLALAIRREHAHVAIGVVVGAAPPLALLALYRVSCFDGHLLAPTSLSAAGPAIVDAGGTSIGLSTLWDVAVGVPTLHRGWVAFAPVTLLFAAGLVRLARSGPHRELARAALVAAAALVVLHVARPFDWRDNAPGPRGSILALPLLALGAPSGLALLNQRTRRTVVVLSLGIAVITTQSSWTWSLLGSIDDFVALGPRSPLLAAALTGKPPDDEITPLAAVIGTAALTASVGACLLLLRPLPLRRRVVALVLAFPAIASAPYFALSRENAENQQREIRIRDVSRAIRFATRPDEARRALGLSRSLSEMPLEADAFEKVGEIVPGQEWAKDYARQIRASFREVDGPRRENVRNAGASPPPRSWPSFGVAAPQGTAAPRTTTPPAPR
jgi:hypothetical protein